MQFVNDDMDDDLFRQAAEKYPLRTDSGDWNKVMEKMQAGGNSHKKGGRARYILLLALIPLLLICTTYIKHDSSVAENRVEKSVPGEQALPQTGLKDKDGPSVDKVAKVPKANDVSIRSSNWEHGQYQSYLSGKYYRCSNKTGTKAKYYKEQQ
jgi:hypothetical protein